MEVTLIYTNPARKFGETGFWEGVGVWKGRREREQSGKNFFGQLRKSVKGWSVSTELERGKRIHE